MENQNESNKSSKNVYESQSLILNFHENAKPQNIHNDHHCGDDVDYQIYQNTIKFTAAMPQVNKRS